MNTEPSKEFLLPEAKDHHPACDWHIDQYLQECNCGAVLRAIHGDESTPDRVLDDRRLLKDALHACEGLEDLEDCLNAALQVFKREIRVMEGLSDKRSETGEGAPVTQSSDTSLVEKLEQTYRECAAEYDPEPTPYLEGRMHGVAIALEIARDHHTILNRQDNPADAQNEGFSAGGVMGEDPAAKTATTGTQQPVGLSENDKALLTLEIKKALREYGDDNGKRGYCFSAQEAAFFAMQVMQPYLRSPERESVSPAALVKAVIAEIDRLGDMKSEELRDCNIDFHELLDMAITLRDELQPRKSS